MSGIIAGNTPQMLIWVCDGLDHPDNLPLPSGAGLNYYQTLLEQCEIAKKSKTPIYLIYSSSLLTEEQTQAMENLANKPGFENLFVQDYEDFKTQCFDKRAYTDSFQEHYGDEKVQILEELFDRSAYNNLLEEDLILRSTQKTKTTSLQPGSIGFFVDTIRLDLISHCGFLKKVLTKKYESNITKKTLLDKSADGVVYRDFDVNMNNIENGYPDIEFADEMRGFLCSTDYQVHKFTLEKCLNEVIKLKTGKKLGTLSIPTKDFLAKYYETLDSAATLVPKSELSQLKYLLKKDVSKMTSEEEEKCQKFFKEFIELFPEYKRNEIQEYMTLASIASILDGFEQIDLHKFNTLEKKYYQQTDGFQHFKEDDKKLVDLKNSEKKAQRLISQLEREMKSLQDQPSAITEKNEQLGLAKEKVRQLQLAREQAEEVLNVSSDPNTRIIFSTRSVVGVKPENSFLAVNQDQHPIMAYAFQEIVTERSKNSSREAYGTVKEAIAMYYNDPELSGSIMARGRYFNSKVNIEMLDTRRGRATERGFPQQEDSTVSGLLNRLINYTGNGPTSYVAVGHDNTWAGGDRKIEYTKTVKQLDPIALSDEKFEQQLPPMPRQNHVSGFTVKEDIVASTGAYNDTLLATSRSWVDKVDQSAMRVSKTLIEGFDSYNDQEKSSAIIDKILENINKAKAKLDPNHKGIDPKVINDFVMKVIEFAQKEGGVGNAGEDKWHDFTRTKQVLGGFTFDDAKQFSFHYQQVAKDSGVYTGRTENLKTGPLIGARLKRIPEDLNDVIKAGLESPSLTSSLTI